MLVTGIEFKHCLFRGGYNSIYVRNGGASTTFYGDMIIDSCKLIDANAMEYLLLRLCKLYD